MRLLVVLVASALVLGIFAMPGGWTKQSLADQSEIDEWWSKLSNVSDSRHHGLLTDDNFNLKSVESQVVSGVIYKFTLEKDGKTCEIRLWVQAWLNKQEVTNDTCKPLVEEIKSEHGRQLGGVQTLTDFSEPGVKPCLGNMLDGINARSNSMYRLVDSNIITATKQVVSGFMYRFKMEVAPSSCRNGDSLGSTSTECAVNSANKDGRSVWSAECWYRDWLTPKAEVSDLKMVRAEVVLEQNYDPNGSPAQGYLTNIVLLCVTLSMSFVLHLL